MAKEKGLGLLAVLSPKKPAGGDSPASLAAQGALQAVKDDDAEAFADAVRTLIDAIKAESVDDEA